MTRAAVPSFWPFPPASLPRPEQKGSGDWQRNSNCGSVRSQWCLLPEALWTRKADEKAPHPRLAILVPSSSLLHTHHQMPSSHILFVCFFVLATLLIRRFHTIHLFKLYNSMVSGIFTELCNHQHNPFLPLQIKPISISAKGQCVDLLLANRSPRNHCFISCSGSSESICIYQKRT